MREDVFDQLERENLKIASFTKRVFAYLIDNIILAVIVFVIFYNEISNAKDSVEITQILGNFYLGIIFLHFIYQTLFTYLYGASLGKMWCKIMVIDEGILDKPSLWQSSIRAIGRQLSDLAFMLGFAWALGNDLRKTWQDYLARTIVIDVE